MENEKLIDEILNHLDRETRMGVVRMSVEMDEEKSAATNSENAQWSR